MKSMSNAVGWQLGVALMVGAAALTMGVPCVEAGDHPAFADAVCWWNFDLKDSGTLVASEVVDVNSGIDGGSIVGTAPLSWVGVPSEGPQGATTDGNGITMVQSNHVTLGTSGVSNDLYGVSRDATVFMRLNLADYANNGQGVKLFETFRWVSGPPNASEGMVIYIYSSGGSSLNGKLLLNWGSEQRGFVALDPNANVLNGIVVKKMPTNEWVDVFAVCEPGANVRIHLNTSSGSFTNSYDAIQNGAPGSAATNWLAAVTAGFTTANLGGGNSSFNGVLESAAVWDRVLTTDEIHGISTFVYVEAGTVVTIR